VALAAWLAVHSACLAVHPACPAAPIAWVVAPSAWLVVHFAWSGVHSASLGVHSAWAAGLSVQSAEHYTSVGDQRGPRSGVQFASLARQSLVALLPPHSLVEVQPRIRMLERLQERQRYALEVARNFHEERPSTPFVGGRLHSWNPWEAAETAGQSVESQSVDHRLVDLVARNCSQTVAQTHCQTTVALLPVVGMGWRARLKVGGRSTC